MFEQGFEQGIDIGFEYRQILMSLGFELLDTKLTL